VGIRRTETAAGEGKPAAARRVDRCPACSGELEHTGSIAGSKGVLYLIARCRRCQTAFWRMPRSGQPWE
jgi:uncharacterized protein with PIN domain